MKRLVILSATVIFAASSLAAAPVSFAQLRTSKNMGNHINSYFDEEEGEDQQKKYTEKDTSWFDYLDPQDTYELSLIHICSPP